MIGLKLALEVTGETGNGHCALGVVDGHRQVVRVCMNSWIVGYVWVWIWRGLAPSMHEWSHETTKIETDSRCLNL